MTSTRDRLDQVKQVVKEAWAAYAGPAAPPLALDETSSTEAMSLRVRPPNSGAATLEVDVPSGGPIWISAGLDSRFEIIDDVQAFERLRRILDSVFRGKFEEELLQDGSHILESEGRIEGEGVVTRHHSAHARSRRMRANAQRRVQCYEPYLPAPTSPSD
jgi:hypothetical protein